MENVQTVNTRAEGVAGAKDAASKGKNYVAVVADGTVIIYKAAMSSLGVVVKGVTKVWHNFKEWLATQQGKDTMETIMNILKWIRDKFYQLCDYIVAKADQYDAERAAKKATAETKA